MDVDTVTVVVKLWMIGKNKINVVIIEYRKCIIKTRLVWNEKDENKLQLSKFAITNIVISKVGKDYS